MVVYAVGAWSDAPPADDGLLLAVRLCIGPDAEPRMLGLLSRRVPCLVADLCLPEKDAAIAREMQSRDRLAKIEVEPAPAAGGILTPPPLPPTASHLRTPTAAIRDRGSPSAPPRSSASSGSDRAERSCRKRPAAEGEPEPAALLAQPTADQAACGRTHPTGRWGHSCTAVPSSGHLLVYGGQGGESGALAKDALWIAVCERSGSAAWRYVVAGGEAPAYRLGHTAAYVAALQRLYVFGGCKQLRWYSDMHALDVRGADNATPVVGSWSAIRTSGRAPTSAYHSMTLFRDELYVFGGVCGHQSDRIPDVCSNSLVVFNLARCSWYEPIVMGPRPRPRSGYVSVAGWMRTISPASRPVSPLSDAAAPHSHATTLLENQLVIFGGWDAPVCFGDTFVLDLTTMEFTPLAASGSAPTARWCVRVVDRFATRTPCRPLTAGRQLARRRGPAAVRRRIRARRLRRHPRAR